MTTAPPALPVRPDAIPAELRARAQWVCWGWAFRGGKWTKQPLNAATGLPASSTDPATWATLDAALSRMARDGLPGVGFVFSPDDPYCGVDLDACRDPETGAVVTWAATIAAELDGYAEISPSGTGLKVIVRAALPGGKGRKDTKRGIELYDRARFFTVTGWRWGGL